ncbi:hypothetical protein QBC32DRAFT_334983 [Pseudoneurospora amorphoporcata]|uniref:Uncharacterized protein n=1 Tax=Pseudoneurospora amorphoporcata TaxID=241081 RepID=A0AAN6NZS8_9PEZI|nr:hypothetical protein QBC32DRAFT_334983 [Pseudoneurospora amorphoporcata]
MAAVYRGLVTSWLFHSVHSSLFPVRPSPGRMRSGLGHFLSRFGNYHEQKRCSALSRSVSVCEEGVAVAHSSQSH